MLGKRLDAAGVSAESDSPAGLLLVLLLVLTPNKPLERCSVGAVDSAGVSGCSVLL
jgi:hypothetical protein